MRTRLFVGAAWLCAFGASASGAIVTVKDQIGAGGALTNGVSGVLAYSPQSDGVSGAPGIVFTSPADGVLDRLTVNIYGSGPLGDPNGTHWADLSHVISVWPSVAAYTASPTFAPTRISILAPSNPGYLDPVGGFNAFIKHNLQFNLSSFAIPVIAGQQYVIGYQARGFVSLDGQVYLSLSNGGGVGDDVDQYLGGGLGPGPLDKLGLPGSYFGASVTVNTIPAPAGAPALGALGVCLGVTRRRRRG